MERNYAVQTVRKILSYYEKEHLTSSGAMISHFDDSIYLSKKILKLLEATTIEKSKLCALIKESTKLNISGTRGEELKIIMSNLHKEVNKS